MSSLFLITVCFWSYKWSEITGLRHNLVYQMDLSEHCRRRVIPSIFLAGNVVDASAYILHFSQMDLPYTCLISIRSESGSNVIMVTKMFSEDGLSNTCDKNNPELLVYEMGETFGGYWGQLSEIILNQQTVAPKFYTLKTTEPSTTEPSTTEETTTQPPSTESSTIVESEEVEDFVTFDVPILNVSGFVVPSNKSTTYDFDALFDINYDVTPAPGVKYDTSVIPLVQFSLKKVGDGREGDANNIDGRRFDLDIEEPYTFDWRLTWPQSRLTTLRYRKQFPKRYRPNRLYFKKNKTPKGKYTSTNPNIFTKYTFPSSKSISQTITQNNSHYSWEYVHELINKINGTVPKDEEKQENSAQMELLEKIANSKHNSSLYLLSNLSDYKPKDTLTTKKINKIITMRTLFTTVSPADITTTESFQKTSINSEPPITNSDLYTNTERSTISTTKGLLYNSYYKQTHSIPSELIDTIPLTIPISKSNEDDITNILEQKKKLASLSHESLDNVVQTKSNMTAMLLNPANQDNASDDNVLMLNKPHHKDVPVRRTKREFHAIEISDAKPHNMTTKKVPDKTEVSFGLADMQEFGELVELSDDDMYGHVALRYLRQYVGTVFYNVCSTSADSKRQQVQLFNSSRIVLAISNLSRIYRMKLVLTAAKTLLTADLRCPGSDIECQVSGARVCIDAMAACDGVPNCGSYDIYDEDRLRCGASQGLEHNVYIAAFTFIAVLLTALYAVHYWLKRCVPKVAEAFFVYTDGDANILYLETIMRSPHDDTEVGPLFYHPNMFDDILGGTFIEKRKLTLWQRFVNIISCRCCKKREHRPSQIEDYFDTQKDTKKKYSFTEFEINKMTEKKFTEMSVQTGSSLEMANFEERGRYYQSSISSVTSPLAMRDSLLTLEEPFPEDHVDELSLLKFLNETRRASDSTNIDNFLKIERGTNGNRSEINEDEKEVTSHFYGSRRNVVVEPGPSGIKPPMRDLSKRIRFEESATTIPPEQGPATESMSNGPRRSVYMDAVKGTIRKFLDTIDEDVETNAANKEFAVTNKEHKRFWGKKDNKGKKPKKNTHVTLR